MQRSNRTHAIVAGLAGASMLAFWAATASAQTMPAPAPTAPPKAGEMTTTRTMAASGDMMADKIQGLTVYTLNPEAKADARMNPPAHDALVKTVTKDEYTRMTKGYVKVGEIDDITITSDGRVKDAVVSVGGFLGVGERNIALGWGDLTFVRTSEGDTLAYIGKTKSDLEKMPEFRPYK